MLAPSENFVAVMKVASVSYDRSECDSENNPRQMLIRRRWCVPVPSLKILITDRNSLEF